jgi:hypothetical protein
LLALNKTTDLTVLFFFQKKKQKALFRFAEVVAYYLNNGSYPKLGEADPGGLGACPQKSIGLTEKGSKKHCSGYSNNGLYPKSAKQTQ